jgi:hypothetical protein
MDESEGETVIALPAPKKEKKPRTPAQISATKKALEALQAKRKENWEVKKKEMKAQAKPPAAEPKVKAPAPAEEAPVKPQAKQGEPCVVGNIVAPGPIDHARGRAVSAARTTLREEDDMPEWARALNEKVDKALKKKKKVVIEESESEDEVVIVKKKKKDDTPPPQPPPIAPQTAPIVKPENPLRRMLYRN